MSKYAIGIDVGGTNIKFGLVSRTGKVVAKSNLKTKGYLHSRTQLINALVKVVEQFIKDNKLKRSEIAGIGVGLPGLINPKKGIVTFLPNIPNWKNVPLKKILQQKLGLFVVLENDVNLITLAEWKFGAGKGVKNLICLTLGTGVGSGLVLDNTLYRGEGFVAGELGHMPLNETGPKCTCGGYGCLERFVGNKEIIKKARKIFRKKDITIPETRKYARKGDKRALKLWEDVATHLGNGLVGVVNLLNPSLIVIGGGVSHSHMYMFKTMRDIIRKRAMSVQAKMVKITRAKLGDDAGLIGAQVLVNEAK